MYIYVYYCFYFNELQVIISIRWQLQIYEKYSICQTFFKKDVEYAYCMRPVSHCFTYLSLSAVPII